METITVALDWTPNTNHTGIYLAKAKGFYKEVNIEVNIISPHMDNYKVTPASRVADGSADLAITPSESVISYHSWPDASKPKIKAVAALLQNHTSAIVTLASSGLTRPKDLDGKVYASYGARYEGRIVQQMIINDGGSGVYKESTPEMLGIWNTLLEGKADATWIFLGWEGVEAEQKGVKLNAFNPEDYGIPYGYSPLLVTSPDALKGPKGAAIFQFLKATARGYQEAAVNPEAAALTFLSAVQSEHAAHPLPQPLDEKMVVASHVFTAKHLLNAEGQWGVMQADKWNTFLDWLSNNGLLTTKVQSRSEEGASTASLNGLRSGDVGEKVARESIKVEDLFTNAGLIN